MSYYLWMHVLICNQQLITTQPGHPSVVIKLKYSWGLQKWRWRRLMGLSGLERTSVFFVVVGSNTSNQSRVAAVQLGVCCLCWKTSRWIGAHRKHGGKRHVSRLCRTVRAMTSARSWWNVENVNYHKDSEVAASLVVSWLTTSSVDSTRSESKYAEHIWCVMSDNT